MTYGYKNERKVRLKEEAELTQNTQPVRGAYVSQVHDPELCVACLTLKKCLFQTTCGKLNVTDGRLPAHLSGSPSQTIGVLLWMSSNCGTAATLDWHSPLLVTLHRLISLDGPIWITCMPAHWNKQFQNAKYSRKETYLSKQKTPQTQ